MKCAYCGKEFRITHAGWGYAYGALYTCSYKCMRAMEREDDDKVKLTQEQMAAVDRLEAEGKKCSEIAGEIGANRQQVVGYFATRKRNAALKEIDDAADAAAAGEKLEKKPAMPPRETRIGIRNPDGERVLKLIEDMLEVIRKIYGV